MSPHEMNVRCLTVEPAGQQKGMLRAFRKGEKKQDRSISL